MKKFFTLTTVALASVFGAQAGDGFIGGRLGFEHNETKEEQTNQFTILPELGYNFKYGRVYVNGDNLAVWSPFDLWDPELNWNTYPLQRTVTLGLQLKF